MTDRAAESPERPWAVEAEAVLEALAVLPRVGLTRQEARARLAVWGPNLLRAVPGRSPLLILADQFKSVLVALLAFASVLSLVLGQWVESAAIAAVLLVNAAIGFATELKAVRSMEALRRMGRVRARVRREGVVLSLPAEDLVPGDVVVVEGGDIVTADIRIAESSRLQVNESMLTGESLPVGKSAGRIADEAPLTDRANMLFKGTLVTRGAGEGVVVATGMGTELGRISDLVEKAEEEVTPLERRLQLLGHRLVAIGVGTAAAVAGIGIATGKEILLFIETGIALAVASVPEGLPVIATITLARGMQRMARRNALVNRLAAVETLGSTTVIFTDKTGTLTENRLAVSRIALADGTVDLSGDARADDAGTEGPLLLDGSPVEPGSHPALRSALEVAVLCNDASLPRDGSPSGDPLEVALLAAGEHAGITREALLADYPEVHEEAFDPEIRMMATVHRAGAGYRVAVKGAPEAVLRACTSVLTRAGESALDDGVRAGLLARNDRMAEEGLRVLGLAVKSASTAGEEVYDGLAFAGMVGLADPPREGVGEAIEACRGAGLRVVIVTGDQPSTARYVARAVGLAGRDAGDVVTGSEIRDLNSLSKSERTRLLGAGIFARVSPEQKLDLIALHQGNGQIVAMTGDGVNDAPALRKADIGIAMGRRGTEVARQAADVILRDDAFGSIAAAIEQGRNIFENIRKFVVYLLSCNISEVLIVGLAVASGAPLPILPLQILFLNMVTDVFPALALGMGRGEAAVMRQPPRDPKEPFLTGRHWRGVAGYGLLITVVVLAAFALTLRRPGMGAAEAVSAAFLTLAFAQLWHVFNMREAGSGFVRNEITRNPYVWAALGLCAGLLVLAVYLPGPAAILKLQPPDSQGWLLVAGMSLLPWAVGQAGKGVAARR